MTATRAASVALTAALSAAPVSATVLQGASSREQAIALNARDRMSVEYVCEAFLARDRDTKEDVLGRFRSDEPKGTVVVFR